MRKVILRKKYGQLYEKYEKLEIKSKEQSRKIDGLKREYVEAMDSFTDTWDLYECIEGELSELKKEIDGLKNEKEACQNKIKELEKKVDELNRANFALKEFIGKEHSNWHIGAGISWRYDLITNKPKKYEIPKENKRK